MSQKFSITNPVWDKVYDAYAWRNNNRTLSLVQGEGITVPAGTGTNATVTVARAKAPRFQLRDDRGVISLSSDNPEILWAVRLPNGGEDLVVCNIVTTGGVTAADGIIEIPIMASTTRYNGHADGEIRLVMTNGTTKFFGINACIGEGVSDAAAAQSTQYSELIAALQKVVALYGADNTADMDVLDNGNLPNGTNPISSGQLKTYLEGNFQTYLGGRFVKLRYAYPNDCTDSQMTNITDGDRIDACVSSDTLYLVRGGSAITNGDFQGIMFCAKYLSDNGTQTQYYLTRTGGVKYRTRDNDTAEWPTTWTSFVDTTTTIAGVDLQDAITADELARALGGKTVYYHATTADPPPEAVPDVYPIPTLWHNTATGEFYLLESVVPTLGFYRYNFTHISRISYGTNTPSNSSGSAGDVYIGSQNGHIWIRNLTSWIELTPTSRTIAGFALTANITSDALARALTGSTIYYHNEAGAPTSPMSTQYPAPVIWRDSTTGIMYFSPIVQGSGDTYVYSWQPLTNAKTATSGIFDEEDYDGAPGTILTLTNPDTSVKTLWVCYEANKWRRIYTQDDIDTLLADKMNIGLGTVNANSGGTAPDTSHVSFTGLQVGKIFVCTTGGDQRYFVKTGLSSYVEFAQQQYINLLLTHLVPRVFTCTLSKNSWQGSVGSKYQTISTPAGYSAYYDMTADVSVNNTDYAQLLADGCTGIVVSATRTNFTLALTAYAYGFTPTEDITIQVTLSPVVSLDT